MKTKIVSALVACTLLISGVLFAQKPVQNTYAQKPQCETQVRHKSQHQMPAFLSDAQKEAMQKIRLETVKKVKPIHDQLRELNAHQQTLATADAPDYAAIDKNLEKIGSLKTELAKITTRTKIEMRSQLTEEQRLKMMSHHKQGQHKKDSKRGRHAQKRG